MQVFESILENFLGPTLVSDLIQAQADRGLKATGASASSLTFTVTDTGKVIRFDLFGAYWWEYQERGRGPNQSGKPSRELVKIIANWIAVKRLSIPLRAAYPIAAKIAREGIQVPNRFNKGGVLSETLKPERVIGLVVPYLSKAFVLYIGSQIFK